MGKVVHGVLIDRFHNHIDNDFLPETHSGFYTVYVSSNMIFLVDYLLEKCIEKDIDINPFFVYLKKIFDIANELHDEKF